MYAFICDALKINIYWQTTYLPVRIESDPNRAGQNISNKMRNSHWHLLCRIKLLVTQRLFQMIHLNSNDSGGRAQISISVVDVSA